VCNVLAFEDDSSFSDFTVAISHDSGQKRGFSGTVGAEQDACITIPDFKIDPFEDLPVPDFDM